MKITLGISLTAPCGRDPLGPELLGTGTTGLVGAATAASYNTTTGAGSVSRAADANNQSYVQFAVEASSTYRIAIASTGSSGLQVRRGAYNGTILQTVNAGQSLTVDVATSASTALTIACGPNNSTAPFTVSSLRKVL